MTSLAASAASARLAGLVGLDPLLEGVSCVETPGRIAPPWVRRTPRWRSSSARSRRAVIGDTPKRSSILGDGDRAARAEDLDVSPSGGRPRAADPFGPCSFFVIA